MHTPYYYEDDKKYLEQILPKLQLIRNLGDKVILAKYLKELKFEDYLPENTQVFDTLDIDKNWNIIFSKDFKDTIISNIENKKNFIIKLWEWASGNNMIIKTK